MLVFAFGYNFYQTAHNGFLRIFAGVDADIGNLGKQLVQTLDLGSAACNIDAGMDDISCHFRRRFFQYHFNGIADGIQIILDCFIHRLRADFKFDRKAADKIASNNDHALFPARQAAAQALF